VLTLCQFLEHVLGSQSLAAAAGHAFTLRTVDLLTLTMLAFWSLSPLGGQSVLRLLHETNSTIIETRPVFYPKVDAQSEFAMAFEHTDVLNRANAVVNSALMTMETLEWTPVDAWNHPKIPRIDELEIAATENSTDRSWYTVDPTGNYSYASLAGVNIVNLSEKGSTNLTVPYEYMYFDCEMSSKTNLRSYSATGLPQPEPTLLWNYLSGLQNKSQLITKGWDGPSNGSNNLFVDNSFFMYIKGTRKKMESLLYGSRYNGRNRFFLWECSMNSVMVEANIICRSDKCGVDRLRRKDKEYKENMSLSRTPYGMAHTWVLGPMFTEALASLGGKATAFRPNPVDAYIYGNSPWAKIADGEDSLEQDWTEYVVKLRKPKEMSRRLTKVLNTYLDSSRWAAAVTLSDPFATKSLNATGQPVDSLGMNSTEATVSLLVPVYGVNALWAALLVICSAALLLLSVFGIFVELRTVAPDIFNYVSSMTRDNPHVNAPSGGSRLDGADRARLLGKMRVQLGDTEPQSRVGYIAFRSIGGSNGYQEGKLRGDRKYY
jgi:hypothetical protein